MKTELVVYGEIMFMKKESYCKMGKGKLGYLDLMDGGKPVVRNASGAPSGGRRGSESLSTHCALAAKSDGSPIMNTSLGIGSGPLPQMESAGNTLSILRSMMDR